MEVTSSIFALVCLAISVVSVPVEWRCPDSTGEKLAECYRHMGVDIWEPNYDVPQMLSNCRSRQGGESYECYHDALTNCTGSEEVLRKLDDGRRAYIEPALDYLCSFAQLIEDRQGCLADISRSAPYDCFLEADSFSTELYEAWEEKGFIELEEMQRLLCDHVTALGSCHLEITQESCGDQTLAKALANFWYASYAEWCE